MGSNPELFCPNLFLHYYESRWFCQLRKLELRRATRFANVCCFMDDLTVFNDAGEFEKSCKKIRFTLLRLSSKKKI